MGYSNLVKYTKISPNKSKRTHAIDTITIHVMGGDMSIESCGDLFSKPTKRASSNYGIDSKGRIACYVPEEYRSWCSSNKDNDNRAITIEVANVGGKDTGYKVSDQAMNSLIELLIDVCKRNNIKELKWKYNKDLIGDIEKQNMTVHRWFAKKDCPGDYLYNKHSYIAEKVNSVLLGNAFRVRVTAKALNIRKEPNGAVVGIIKDKGIYTITDVRTVNATKWYKLKSGAGWICSTYTTVL